MTRRPVVKTHADALRTMCEAGATRAEMAAALGLTEGTVYQYLWRLGLRPKREPKPPKPPKQPRHRRERTSGAPSREYKPREHKHDERIRDLHAAGLHNAEIQRRIGVQGDAVRRALQRLGLTRNDAPKPERTDEPPTPARGPKTRPLTENERARALLEVVSCQCGVEGCGWAMTATVAETRDAFTRHRTACPIPIVFPRVPAPPAELPAYAQRVTITPRAGTAPQIFG